MKTLTMAALAGLLALPAFAEGDAAKGEKAFKKCKSCHMIVADDGTVIFKGGKTGPNLYGVAHRPVGSTDFKYSASLKAYGETGAEWNEEDMVAWLQDPKKFLQTKLDDSKAKTKMSFKLKKGGEDVYAYLLSVGPAEEAASEEESTESN